MGSFNQTIHERATFFKRSNSQTNFQVWTSRDLLLSYSPNSEKACLETTLSFSVDRRRILEPEAFKVWASKKLFWMKKATFLKVPTYQSPICQKFLIWIPTLFVKLYNPQLEAYYTIQILIIQSHLSKTEKKYSTNYPKLQLLGIQIHSCISLYVYPSFCRKFQDESRRFNRFWRFFWVWQRLWH